MRRLDLQPMVERLTGGLIRKCIEECCVVGRRKCVGAAEVQIGELQIFLTCLHIGRCRRICRVDSRNTRVQILTHQVGTRRILINHPQDSGTVISDVVDLNCEVAQFALNPEIPAYDTGRLYVVVEQIREQAGKVEHYREWS